MKSILSFLNGCGFGKKQTCLNLTLFPVLHSNGVEPYYLTLEQAIESGVLTITEVDDAGNGRWPEATQGRYEGDIKGDIKGTLTKYTKAHCIEALR